MSHASPSGRRAFALCLFALVFHASRAGADPAARPPARAVIVDDGTAARLEIRTSSNPAQDGARLVVGGHEPAIIHDGTLAATVVFGHGAILVPYVVDDARSPLRVRVAGSDGRVGEPMVVARTGARHDVPFAVVAAVVPDGFTVFYQLVERADPTSAHTYLARLGRDGRPTETASEVAIPWSLADAVWNGTGYHLALLYPGGDGMRLSMVATGGDGAPLGHPDWSSAAGFIGDVHLVAASDHIRAFYRGGGAGNRLLESDVTAIRNWGDEPPPARDHGALGDDEAIAVAMTKSGPSPRRVR
jgi:hypothetical protein